MAQLTLAQRAAVAPTASKSSQVRSRSLQLSQPAIFTAQPFRPAVRSQGRQLITRAKEVDFDEFLATLNDKFEKSENKPVVIGYAVAAVAAVFISEWFIHLPLFNVLLGFPIQLLGLLLVPYLGIRYFIDNEDWYADASDAADRVVRELPGLKKE